VREKYKDRKFYAPRSGPFATIVFLITYSVVLLFDKLVTRVRIYGKEHIDEIKGGGFVVSNHSLYLDPALISVALYPRRVFFSAMEETFYTPVLRSYIRSLGAFPISGKMPGSILIRIIGKMIHEGRLVHVFPEGNLLHLNRKLQDFKDGVFELAALFGKPVLPLTIITIPRKSLGKTLNKFLCRVEIRIGKPIFPDSFGSNGHHNGNGKKELAHVMCVYTKEAIQRDLDFHFAGRKNIVS
jgi:1-acyl-sn-glycerol-3-phosphate acyltransferase